MYSCITYYAQRHRETQVSSLSIKRSSTGQNKPKDHKHVITLLKPISASSSLYYHRLSVIWTHAIFLALSAPGFSFFNPIHHGSYYSALSIRRPHYSRRAFQKGELVSPEYIPCSLGLPHAVFHFLFFVFLTTLSRI